MAGLLTRMTAPLSRAGLVRPPDLKTDEERSASRLELFFDLAFVLVVAELADALGEDLSLHGVGVFAGLFAVTWWSWGSSTLYANRFDTDDVVFRLLKLTSMLAVIGMAASAAEATGSRSTEFAVCYALVRALLFLQYLRAHRSVASARSATRLYMLGTGAGGVLWAVSLLTPEPLRYVLWTAGVLVDVLVPIVATRSAAQVPLHLQHLPERLGLFVILVLGESVASVATGVDERDWTAPAVLVGGVAFLLTAALWWSTFDLAGAAAKKLLVDDAQEGRRSAEDVFFFGSLPMTLGLAAVGVGIQHLVLESTEPDTTQWARTVLCGGVALYLAGVSLTNTAMSGSWRSGWWWPSAAAAVAAADIVLDVPALATVAVLAALLVVVVAIGTVQEARGRVQLEQL